MSVKRHPKLRLATIVAILVVAGYVLAFFVYRDSRCWGDVGDQRPILVTSRTGLDHMLYCLFYPALKIDEAFSQRQYVCRRGGWCFGGCGK